MKIELSTHSDLLQVIHNPSIDDCGPTIANQKFDSKIVSKCSFKKGDLITRLENFIEVGKSSYLTVQIGPSKHVYLNSNFNYLNHSCDPNLKIDVKKMAYVAVKDISPGDDLTFFYPSTEWNMDQPFECWCGSEGVS